MLNKRVQPVIDVFFSQLYHIPQEIRQATSSSFTRCRAKIIFTAFKEVMQQLVQFFYSNYHFKKYYGYRLIAIDGSVFTLPRAKEMIAEFGENVLSNSGIYTTNEKIGLFALFFSFFVLTYHGLKVNQTMHLCLFLFDALI